MSEPHIEDYLSYGEKRIYEAIQDNMRVQKQIIEHIEILRKNDIENTQRNKDTEGLMDKIRELLVGKF